jgi:hypothetical protein
MPEWCSRARVRFAAPNRRALAPCAPFRLIQEAIREGYFSGVLAVIWTAVTMPGYGQVPKMWDDDAMATLEVPLAEASASPRFPPADYYYRIPVGPIYKSYVAASAVRAWRDRTA